MQGRGVRSLGQSCRCKGGDGAGKLHVLGSKLQQLPLPPSSQESHGAGAGGRVGVAPGGGGDDPGGLGVLTGYGSSSESD